MPAASPDNHRRNSGAMGTPRELLNFLVQEVYRYRLAMHELLPGLDHLADELRQKPDSDFFARVLDDNVVEKWRAVTQAQFILVAVRGVLQMAQAIRTLSGQGGFPAYVHARVSSAIAQFDKDANHAKDMRDLLTHLDAYLLGVGRKDLPSPEHRIWLAAPEGNFAIYVGGVALSVRGTVDAADRLAKSVTDVVARLESEEKGR